MPNKFAFGVLPVITLYCLRGVIEHQLNLHQFLGRRVCSALQVDYALRRHIVCCFQDVNSFQQQEVQLF